MRACPCCGELRAEIGEMLTHELERIVVERLSVTPSGQVRYAFRKEWRDGSMAVEMSPLTLPPPDCRCLLRRQRVLSRQRHATRVATAGLLLPPPEAASAVAAYLPR